MVPVVGLVNTGNRYWGTSVARTVTSYTLSESESPGTSKSGGDLKRSSLPDSSNLVISTPPVRLQTTASSAVKVCTALVFSATDFEEDPSPAEPLGPVMTGPVTSVAAAAKVKGLPVKPALVTVKVFAPAVVPSIQLPTVAIPAASVVAVPPVMLPPPEATAKVTDTPETGLLFASVTNTLGAVETAVPTGAL